MGAWDTYNARLSEKGGNLRDARKSRLDGFINRRLPKTLSYFTALVDGIEQELAIINTDNFDIKKCIALPGEDISSGSIVEWKDNHWLVFEEDVNDEAYKKATMQQCNHLLKWIALDENEEPVIRERWCVVFDGTRYLTGETMSRYVSNGLTLGDSRAWMLISRDADTVKLGRANRFLIDDEDSDTTLSYSLSKPFKLGGVFNKHGSMSFVLTEVNSEDDDNFELRIADYYKYFPRPGAPTPKEGSWL